jgi:glyoxylase-like metal-dependent hydrolase (beta-lactamase superfamily II)
MIRNVSVIMLLLSLILFVSTASSAQPFTPKQGLYYMKEVGGVKFHVYTSPMPAGASASVVIETKNALILQDVQQNKPQMDDLKSLIQSIGKPLRRIYISHDHSHHWAGLETFPGIPVYANQPTIDAMKQKGEGELQALKSQFGAEAIPYAKVIVPGNVVEAGSQEVVYGVRFVFSSPAPQLTGPVIFMEFPDQKVMITHHLAYVGVHVPLPPVDGRLAKLNEMKGKDWAWVIGGHGIPVPGPEYFSKTIDYYTTLGKVIKESPDAATAKDKMLKAYPSYGGVVLLDLLLPGFFQK